MNKASTTIDDIMFPMHQSRTLKAQIECIDRMLAAIESNRVNLDAIHEALPEDSDLAMPERGHYALSNGDTVTVDFYQISANCWTAKDANHDSRTGVDKTRELALQDLLRMCEADLEDSCDDGRARVVSEPQRRDAEFRRIVARTQP